MTNTAEVQMKSVSEEQERRNFEAWFLTFRPDWSPDDFTMTNYISGKCYASGYLRAAWKGWQARAAQGTSHE